MSTLKSPNPTAHPKAVYLSTASWMRLCRKLKKKIVFLKINSHTKNISYEYFTTSSTGRRHVGHGRHTVYDGGYYCRILFLHDPSPAEETERAAKEPRSNEGRRQGRHFRWHPWQNQRG